MYKWFVFKLYKWEDFQTIDFPNKVENLNIFENSVYGEDFGKTAE